MYYNIFSPYKWYSIFFKIDVNANISNIFNKTPELDLTISPEEKLVEKGGKKSSSDKKIKANKMMKKRN